MRHFSLRRPLMTYRTGRWPWALTCLVAAVTLGAVALTSAQEKPRSGGELIFVVPAEPPSFDAHREETFGMLHPAAPHYNTLLRVDPFDKTGTKFIGDLAESWTVSSDKRTFTFKLRRGVKFHDGSLMTSADVKSSYDHIIFPPPTVASSRQAAYHLVEAVEAPSPDTVVFRLKWYEASFIANLSSPWNWIYRAEILAKDPRWYEKNVNGTGPFKFVEYQRGSKALSRIALVKDVAGIQAPGTPWATPPEELTRLAGYGHDINAARAEARRLLKEAGAEGLSFTLLNRAVPMPYEPVGVWLIDQWRQIGVTVKQTVLESAAWLQAQKNSEFEVSVTATCNSIVEPDMDLHWFLTTSPWNIGRHKDTMLDELYQKQSRAVDPEERKKYLRAFEKRLYDEEVDYILPFQWHRIIAHLAMVAGWTVTPSHYLNQQLDTVWLSE